MTPRMVVSRFSSSMGERRDSPSRKHQPTAVQGPPALLRWPEMEVAVLSRMLTSHLGAG